LKEISQTVILLVWRLGDRPERKNENPKKKKSEQFLHPSGARRMKIHTFCLKMNFFIAKSFLFFSLLPSTGELPFRKVFPSPKAAIKAKKSDKNTSRERT
jgi:hypothetical protein